MSAFRPWIDCIVKSVGKGYSQEKVERICKCVDRDAKEIAMDPNDKAEKAEKDLVEIEESCNKG